MKKNLWMLTISAVIACALIFTTRFAVAQDLGGPAVSSTQSQLAGIEHNELDKDPPSLIQNWILSGVGFVLMVAPFIWWHIKRGQHEKED
jgi:hypothetical protein